MAQTVLKTKRLHLSELTFDDLENVHDLHCLPETDEFNTLGIPENIQVTEKIVQDWLRLSNEKPDKLFVFTIRRSEDKSFVGLIGLILGKQNYQSAEGWFKTHKDFWGQGFTTEALNKLLEFGFQTLKLHRIEAGCAVENHASVRVLEKVGMTCEGIRKKKLPIRGEWRDNYFFAILEEDF